LHDKASINQVAHNKSYGHSENSKDEVLAIVISIEVENALALPAQLQTAGDFCASLVDK